jgi:hypothetical protein
MFGDWRRRGDSPGLRTVLTVGVAFAVVTVGVGLFGFVGVASATTTDAAQPAVQSPSTAENTVFAPVSQPPVIALVGTGMLALSVLVLIKLRGILTGSGTEGSDATDREEPWKPESDVKRVVQLLQANDGYMKQSRIVEQTDWSKAKVSRLLTQMAENGRITKNKDGRENIIILEQ